MNYELFLQLFIFVERVKKLGYNLKLMGVRVVAFFNKKNISVLVLIFILLGVFFNKDARGSENLSVDHGADTVLLMEMSKGQVLYEKNMHEKKHPASTTKILTALLLLQNSSLSEQVKITENAFRVRGSTLHLNKGMTISVRDLLYGIMLRSANDGAVAAAEHVSGSVDEFLDKMNRRAKEFGAKNSNFQNPHGLSNGYPEHKTTAYDLAMISREALKCPIFRKIVKTDKEEIILDDGKRDLHNNNKLLGSYDGLNGIKTGYTSKSGYTFVASATREETTLLAVVLGQNTWEGLFEDAKNLMDYGFENYEKVEIVEQGEKVGSINMDHGIDVELYTDSSVSHMVSLEESEGTIKKNNEVKETISFPLEKNDRIGKVQILDEQEEKIGKSGLIIKEDIDRPLKSYFVSTPVLLMAVIMVTGIFILLKNKKREL